MSNLMALYSSSTRTDLREDQYMFCAIKTSLVTNKLFYTNYHVVKTGI